MAPQKYRLAKSNPGAVGPGVVGTGDGPGDPVKTDGPGDPVTPNTAIHASEARDDGDGVGASHSMLEKHA